MFKSTVGCARIDAVSERKLMNASKSLEWAGIDYIALQIVEMNKSVDRIPHFMTNLSFHFELSELSLTFLPRFASQSR